MSAPEPEGCTLRPGQFEPLFPLLSAFSRIFDREEEMPKDPTSCLRRIGWIVADCFHRSGDSTGHSLAEELRCEAGGRRSELVWDPVRLTAVRNQPSVKHGWVLKEVLDTNTCEYVKSAQLRYEYTSSVTGEQHVLQLTTRAGDAHEFAHFFVHGTDFYWYQNMDFCTFARENLHGNRLELVAVRAATVVYSYYDRMKNDCLVHRTFTTSHKQGVCVYHFKRPWRVHGRMPEFDHFFLSCHLNYRSEEEAVLTREYPEESVYSRLERLSQDLRVVTGLSGEPERRAGAGIPKVVPLPHLTRRLTERRRARFVRVARTLLLTKAQEAEERRAADPVRKCAACAVEAVKSQLALGIEPIESVAKRERVSA